MKPRPLTQIGLFLITLSVMGIELLEMRLLSFMLWHHLAYMVISIALLGLGAGGGLLAIQSQRILSNWVWWLSGSSMLGGSATVVAVAVLSRFELDTFELTPGKLGVLTFHYAMMSITYIAAGLAVAIILTRGIGYINRLYFIDLMGAGTGAILTYFIIEPLGAPMALVLMAATLTSSGICFAYDARAKWLLATSVTLGLVLSLSILWSDHIMDIQAADTKALAYHLRTKDGANIVSTKWTPLARIDLLEANESTHPFVTELPGEDVKMISIDGDAQTFMFRRPDVRTDLPTPNRDTLTNYEFSFLLKDAPEVLIIGPGGGKEIFAAH